MVAADSYVAQIFADGCWSTGRAAKYCVSDEHYVPTLLAWHGEILAETQVHDLWVIVQ